MPPFTKSASVSSLLRRARNATHEHPTAAQKASGNYKKGRLKMHDLSIAIENPVGSKRRGIDKSGKAWESTLTCDYGYFCATQAVDGDAVDVFIGPDHDSELVVAIDQMIDGKYDETKFVMCVKTQRQGEKLYLSNYQKGWKLGPVSTTTVGQLKNWLKEGNTRKPFKGQLVKAAGDFRARDTIRSTSNEPESIGTGLGAFLSDAIPLLPSGARRAGAARVMAARVDRDPSFLVNHPITSQLAALGLSSIGGLAANTPTQRAAAALPILLTQALKGVEIRSIQKDYDKKKRKRLRELENLDALLGGIGGSSRLGAVGAYEAMRRRKYQDIGSIAEAADALTYLSGPAAPLTIPVTSYIDHRAADRIQKQADFSDQKNNPVVPLLLAAALGSTVGQIGAAANMHNQLADAPKLDRREWQGLINHVSGINPRVVEAPGLGNAFFHRSRNADEAARMVGYLGNFPDGRTSAYGETRADAVRRSQTDGSVAADPDFGTSAVLAHEAGHAKIEHTPGVLRALQRHAYGKSQLLAPVLGASSMAAGLASQSTLKGALLGTGIGVLGNIGTLAPEAGASYYGIKGLRDYQGGRLNTNSDVANLVSAYATYLASSVLPSTLAGAAGGWIGGARTKDESAVE